MSSTDHHTEAALEHALGYAARGWRVCPLHNAMPGGGCSCNRGGPCRKGPKHTGKHPRTQHGFNDATVDVGQVRDWWLRDFPAASIGIATGAGSGLVVLDIDADKGGPATLADLEERHGRLPHTPTVLTGGGGEHRYFRHPGVDIGSSVSEVGAGIDVRGDGGMVVAPPSPHKSGRLYHWELSSIPEDVPLATFPENWVAAIRNPSRRGTESTDVTSVLSALSALSVLSVPPPSSPDLDALFKGTLPTKPGERRLRLFNLARRMRFHPTYEHAPLDSLQSIVFEWHRRAAPFTSGEHSPTESWRNFKDSWPKVRFPEGTDVAEVAMERARLIVPCAAIQSLYPEDPNQYLLAALCMSLQDLTEDEPFSLSCRQAARLLNLPGWNNPDANAHRRAWRMLTGFVEDGLLKCVVKGKEGAAGSPASRYRWIWDGRNREAG